LSNELLELQQTGSRQKLEEIKEIISQHRHRTVNLLKSLKELKVDTKEIDLIEEYERASLVEAVIRKTNDPKNREDLLKSIELESDSNEFSGDQISLELDGLLHNQTLIEDSIKVKIARLDLLISEWESEQIYSPESIKEIREKIYQYNDELNNRAQTRKVANEVKNNPPSQVMKEKHSQANKVE
jgi:hypothetical protein